MIISREVIRHFSEKRAGVFNKIAVLISSLSVLLFFFSILSFASVAAAAESDSDTSWIAADLAAGADTTRVITKATSSGMSIETAVAALVKVGSNPGVVTYAAITADNSPTRVIKGVSAAVLNSAPNTALNNNMQDTNLLSNVTLVFSAALQAGANRSDIAKAARDMGISTTVIAQAIVNADSTPSSAFGNTISGGATTSALGKVLSTSAVAGSVSGNTSTSEDGSPTHP